MNQQQDLNIMARERSHQDARQKNEYVVYLFQSMILVNGAAAIAVLTYFGSLKREVSVWVMVGIGAYDLGVLCGVLCGMFFKNTIHHWSIIWERKSYGHGDDDCGIMRSERRARLWGWWSGFFQVGGVVSFLVGSALLIGSFYAFEPTSIPEQNMSDTLSIPEQNMSDTLEKLISTLEKALSTAGEP